MFALKIENYNYKIYVQNVNYKLHFTKIVISLSNAILDNF